MNPKQDRDLEEALGYMREQFRPLTQSIPIPATLHADILRKRMDAMPEEQRQLPTAGRLVRFPLKRVLGVAACFAVVIGSYLAFYNAGGLTPQVLFAPDASPAEAGTPVPMAAAAPQQDAGAGAAAPDTPETAAYDAPMPRGAMPRGAMPASEEEIISENDQPGLLGYSLEQDPDKMLTSFAQAREVPGRGLYLPLNPPEGLDFADGYAGDELLCVTLLSADYSKELRLGISEMTPAQQAYLVNPAQPETYDMRLYPMPWTESVSEELWWITNQLIFKAEELTLAMVEARNVASIEPNDPKSFGQFQVLFGDMVVSYQFTNIPPEELLGIIQTTSARG